MRKGPLLMSLVVLSAVAGGSFAYGWHSVTQPEPTTAVAPAAESDDAAQVDQPSIFMAVEGADSPGPASPSPSITEQLSTLTNEPGPVTLTLDEPQLNQLINDAIFRQEQVAQILTNARSLTTVLEGDRIETGTSLNLSEIPLEGLPPAWQESVTQLTTAVPMLANREIYIGIVAQPQVQDGQIRLDQDLSLKLGQFTLPLADVAGQVGLSMADIEQRLNAVLEERGIALDTIDILDEKLVITGDRP